MMVDKSVGERKIKLKDYIPLLKKTFSDESINDILKIFSENLPCSDCKKMLPLDQFAVSRVNIARMGRFTVCRPCHKENYKALKELI